MISSTRNISFILDGCTPKEFTVTLVPIEKSLRLSRAVKSLAIFWGCAAISIFIPMLHFVLVPGFFLAGIFFAANSYSDNVKIEEPGASCLKCGGKTTFKNLADHFPKWATCAVCGAEHRAELIK